MGDHIGKFEKFYFFEILTPGVGLPMGHGHRPTAAPPQVSVLVRADFKKIRFSSFVSVILMHFLSFFGYF